MVISLGDSNSNKVDTTLIYKELTIKICLVSLGREVGAISSFFRTFLNHHNSSLLQSQDMLTDVW